MKEKMTLTIERVANGYLVQWCHTDQREGGEYIEPVTETFVFENLVSLSRWILSAFPQ